MVFWFFAARSAAGFGGRRDMAMYRQSTVALAKGFGQKRESGPVGIWRTGCCLVFEIVGFSELLVVRV